MVSSARPSRARACTQLTSSSEPALQTSINIGNARHKAALKRLQAALNKWIAETNDQGRVLEPPALAAAKGVTKPGSNPSAEAIRPHRQP